MSVATHYPHIEFDPAGTAIIAGTRYKVRHLAAEHFQHGWTAEELLRQHPDLRPEQVYAALTYFYDHYDGMLAELKSSASAAESLRQSHGMSRDELLKQQASCRTLDGAPDESQSLSHAIVGPEYAGYA